MKSGSTSRAERRARHAVDRRYSKRAAAHRDCVLERDTIGVIVRIKSAEDVHRFHVARGEEKCARCPMCALFKERGAWPRKMSVDERRQAAEQWVATVVAAKAEAARDAAFEQSRATVAP